MVRELKAGADSCNASRVAVRMEHVECRRGEERVLSDLSLTIPEGQWVCIAGRNGSGKSTLVRLMNGLLPHSEGRIVIDGLKLTPHTCPEIRRRVGMVFANPDDQFVGLTVEDDIAFGLENLCLRREEMQERIERYAERLGIKHLLRRHPATLSGGQKQRAALAAVLAMEPRIVIVDEGTSMLDERSKQELLGIMQEMRASGAYTLISVTHDVEEMAQADRMLVIHDGGIVADGSPRDLLGQDELLQMCRLKPPYPLLLSRELRQRGIEIGDCLSESEVAEALWAYHLNGYRIATGTGG
ncbi:ATP-binding cassette domain-containing protein [Paenibacillus sp. FSL M8-0334]|uniref:ATP-binding cassette domain-containing protein n=1 Tax=Paenibacillus sp. FSL M8-0334 TaxID=2921623 RepID=UPI0030F87D61